MLNATTLKRALKRGALTAAANWPVTLIQATAEWLFKILVAMPLVGGIFLVALVVGAEPGALLSLGWRDLLATIVASLLSRPLVLAAFVSSLGLAIVGGSLFVFLVKGGTIGILVRAERGAGPIEEAPLRLETIATAAAFSVELFVETAWTLFPRYARLGAMLTVAYGLSGGVFLAFTFGPWGTTEDLAMTALLTITFVVWLTVINLLYLLLQIVIAADDCSVATAIRRVSAFLRRRRAEVASVFIVVLALVVASTGASLLATAALGLIAFVPFVGIAVLPLQLLAWMLRGVIFQYIDLASIVAYVQIYRDAAAAVVADVDPLATPVLGRPRAS